MNPDSSNTRESPTQIRSDPPPSEPAPDSSRAIEQNEGVPASESTGSEPPQPKRRSSIRPAPADWQPPSQRRLFAPMVVVYSGDSDRPPPEFDSRAPSERATQIDIELTAPPQPFPLAGDLTPPSGEDAPPRETVLADRAAPSSEPEPTTLSTRTSDPEKRVDVEAGSTPVLSADPKVTQSGLRVWPFIVLGALAALILIVALPSADPTPLQVPPRTAHVAEPESKSSPLEDSRSPRPALVEKKSESPASPEPLTWVATPAPASAADEGALAQWVTLEVFPEDTKVFRRGLRVAGPPYSFKIPKGGRVAVELARAGFVTRKVVLDGSEPNVVIGLFRKNPGSPAQRSRSSKADSTLDAHSTVQSGL